MTIKVKVLNTGGFPSLFGVKFPVIVEAERKEGEGIFIVKKDAFANRKNPYMGDVYIFVEGSEAVEVKV